MLSKRVDRRRITTLIFGLILNIIFMSALTDHVRADSSLVDNDATATSTSTPTPTWVSTATATRTPSFPFSCSMLSLSNKRLFDNQFRIDIQNDNQQSTFISRVQITWPNIPSFAQTGLTQMSLNASLIWNGPDPQNLAQSTTTTDTDAKPNPPFLNDTTARELLAQESNVYGATFSGPPMLVTYVSYNQYAVTFTIDNPLSSTPCVLTSTTAAPTVTPTVTWQPSATLTPTPNCASSLIAIKFNSFSNFGMVRFDILSQRSTTSTLVGFNINWQKYVNSQRLRQVSLGAPPGLPGATVVWQGSDVNEDTNPPTNSALEGSWLTNFTLPPGALGTPSVTPIYFDFDGMYSYEEFAGSTNPYYGGASDFNFSTFKLTCGTTGGGSPTSQITPELIPSPTPGAFPTNPPPPATATGTYTPASTVTPTHTPASTVTMTYMPSATATTTIAPTVTLAPTLTSTATVTLTSTLVPPSSEPGIAPDRNIYKTDTPTLTWSRVTWAARYEIQISMDINFDPTQTLSAFVSNGKLEYTTPSLSDGLYYWRVRALDVSDNSSAWSNMDRFYIQFVSPSATASAFPTVSQTPGASPSPTASRTSTPAFPPTAINANT